MKRQFISATIALLFFLNTLSAQELRTVARVIDGDTIQMEGGERVRLIGVDTPETVHPSKPVEIFGKEASDFTRRILEGKKVRLEYDQERKDKYGRTLAYVYLEDGTFINAEIIKQGFGFVYTQFPFKYLNEFRNYERQARERGAGLWGEEKASQPELARPPTATETSADSDKKAETVYVTRTGEKYHRGSCQHLRRSKIEIKKSEAIRQGYEPCKVCRP